MILFVSKEPDENFSLTTVFTHCLVMAKNWAGYKLSLHVLNRSNYSSGKRSPISQLRIKNKIRTLVVNRDTIEKPPMHISYCIVIYLTSFTFASKITHVRQQTHVKKVDNYFRASIKNM